MRGAVAKLAAGAAVLVAFGLASPAAHADTTPSGIQLGADGLTADQFSYPDAIRERVTIPVNGVDQDGDTFADEVSVDIIRPKETAPVSAGGTGLKVPAIIDDSPYYTSVGRGNETQYIHTTANGTLDEFPLFYDNYFVSRGYAVILADAIGTAFSTGCPLHGGPGDVDGFKTVIDWLMGRATGFYADGSPAVASWDNGKNAMIGKSYDGTFANGVASTGVDGLTTIVPISAISSWYDYSRMGGIRENTHYPASLDNSITRDVSASILGVAPPVNHNTHCASVIAGLNNVDGDDTGDMNAFWQARDYLDNGAGESVDNVHAAVFESHGINDDNVRPKQFAQWWAGLTRNNVPRKLWLSQEGHVDPFDYHRDAWVTELHKWFDYWLQGVNDGVMNEPQVTIERSPDVYEDDASWPLPGTKTQDMFLQGSSATQAGSMGLSSGGATSTLQFTDQTVANSRGTLASPAEATQMSNPSTVQAGRLAFLSKPLTAPLHISGTPYVDLWASLDKPQSNIGAILVDYGTGDHVNAKSNEGVKTDTNAADRQCYGDSTPADSACYEPVTKVVQSYTQFRISKGILDSSNRDSLYTGTPVTPGQEYEFKFDILPTDYVVPAGHQIGLIVVGNYTDFSSVAQTAGATFTVDTKKSNLQLPVVGGYQASLASGAFNADTIAPVISNVPANITTHTSTAAGAVVTYTLPTVTDNEDPNPTIACDHPSGSTFTIGETLVTCTATDASGNTSTATFTVTVGGDQTVGGRVPSTLSLTLGAAPDFGTFTPGVDKTYTASTSATVISTAGDALLTVADPDTAHPGHLVNNAFALSEGLQAKATDPGTSGSPFNQIGASYNLLAWSAPVSNDPVTISFQQHIGATEALRTGVYSKQLTYTLTTTTP